MFPGSSPFATRPGIVSPQSRSSLFLCGLHCFFSLSVPGLDYVSHEDILPYTSTDQVPIQHELFERFLLYDQTKGELSQEGKLEWESPSSKTVSRKWLQSCVSTALFSFPLAVSGRWLLALSDR